MVHFLFTPCIVNSEACVVYKTAGLETVQSYFCKPTKTEEIAYLQATTITFKVLFHFC